MADEKDFSISARVAEPPIRGWKTGFVTRSVKAKSSQISARITVADMLRD